MNPIEVHPFEPFIPTPLRILIVGSFPGREQTQGELGSEEWFYGAKRNQFWKILSGVFQTSLNTRSEKQQLLEKYGIGMTDVLFKVRRKNPSNLDINLEIIEFNVKHLNKILVQHAPQKILLTSKFVGKHFLRLFPSVSNYDYLPSPSPRYAVLSLEEKIAAYKQKLLF